MGLPVRLQRVVVVLSSLLNWSTWALMAALIGSQFLGIVRDTTTLVSTSMLGRDPNNALTPLGGFNDEPYADRAIVCLTQGRLAVPMQLATVLADPKLATVIDTTGTSIHAIRVVKRTNEMKLQPQIAAIYAHTCDRIDYTLDAIQDSCLKLGFNITRDTLRVIEGVGSNTTREIPKALPILLMPFADNGASMSYIIPAWDGSACVVRLHGTYQAPANTFGVLRAVPRAVREAKVVEWLKNPGGVWRNGWYEAPDRRRWFVNMITSSNSGPYGLQVRQFDTLANKELDCVSLRSTMSCKNTILTDQWSRHIVSAYEITRYDQAFATNGSRFGLFLYDATTITRTTNAYSLETFLSNASVFVILVRWLVSLVAMLYSYYRGIAVWETTGIGALSSSRTFNLFPLVMLPKLKLTLCAFFTVGCYFEGQQAAFANAWYIIYPGIVDLMLYYYSLLNTIAKLTYRRMSDALFGPTLLCLCALHYYRQAIAAWGVLDLNDRIPTKIFSSEVDALTIGDFFTSDAAMRLNGNVKIIFYLKLSLLALSLLPLLVSENMTATRGKKYNAYSACDIERAVALRASNLGGLGLSRVYASIRRREAPQPTDIAHSHSAVVPLSRSFSPQKHHTDDPHDPRRISWEPHNANGTSVHDHVLIGYEMSRLGYLVFGDRYLVSFDDWYIITSMAPLRLIEKLWNYRITIYEVARLENGVYRVVGYPRVCRLDDPRLLVIPFYQVSVCAFQ